MRAYRTSQVFVPGGLPDFTYVDRNALGLEDRVRQASDNLCKLVTVTGATKSGKTVLVSKVFPRTECVWLDGGGVTDETDLWTTVLEELDGHTGTESEETRSVGTEVSAEIGGRARIPLVADAEGKGGVGRSNQRGNATRRSRDVSPRAAAIRALRNAEVPLVVDDFHYLPRNVQGQVIRALKPLIAEGLPVVLIAIPHRRYDAVRVEREMTGRLEDVEVPSWKRKELARIADGGFPLLNIELARECRTELTEEAYGSPHLMQEFCRRLALEHGVDETARRKQRISEIDKELFVKVAEGTGKVVFDKLARGPRQRSDRIERQLLSGETGDIYEVVLFALAHLGPGLDTIEYEELRGAIRDVLSDNIPQAHEVTRVLEKMAEIAAADEASTPVIDWESEDQRLHITDPFFAFFLKWGVEQT